MDTQSRFESLTDNLAAFLARRIGPVAATSIVLIAVFLHSATPDPDLFARMAMGRLIVEQGVVPHVDPFAFTPKNSVWIDHEWLAGLVFYEVWQLGGDTALFLFKCLAVVATLCFLRLAQREFAGGREALFIWFFMPLVQCAYLWTTTVRSQIFTYLFLAIYLWAFVREERSASRRELFLLPPLMILWANMHGGFVVGLGLLGLFTLSSLTRGVQAFVPLLLTLCVCLGATFINPHGIAYWSYILHAVTMSRPDIAEWQSLSPFTLGALVPNLVVLCLFAGICLSPRGRNLGSLLLLLSALTYGYRHYRLQAIFLFVSVVYGAPFFLVLLDRIQSRLRILVKRSGALVLSTGLVVALAVSVVKFIENPKLLLDYSGYPVQAVEKLSSSFGGGNLLVDFNAGSYALWTLHPKFKVSMDGRYEEVYPPETVYLVDDALNPERPNHLAALNAVNPDYILLAVQSRAFSEHTNSFIGWNVIHEDRSFALLGRAEQLGN